MIEKQVRNERTLSRRLFLGLMGGSLTAAGPTELWRTHGFSESQYRSVVELMQGGVDRQQIAGGSLLLISAGDVIFREAFGFANLEQKRPFTVDTLCHIASLTKPVTSTVLMQLVERGKVGLDEPVSRYIPEFKEIQVRGKGRVRTPPIVRQLVSHRSGLPGNNEFPEHLGELRYKGISLGEMVRELIKYGLVAEPGTRHAYSRAGFMTAGRVIEIVAGQEFADAAGELLLTPLGMKASTFRPSDSQLQSVPTGYQRRQGELRVARDPTDMPEGFLVNPGGGLFSTVDDMSRFLMMHLAGGEIDGRRILKTSSVKAMQERQPQIPGEDAEHGAYGLGWGLTREGVGRLRHIGAAGTVGWLDPERNIAGVLLTQTHWAGNRAWQNQFTRRMNEILMKSA